MGGRLGLHGHGVRSRQLRGPDAPGSAPRLLEVGVRRYRCVGCRATCTVAPRETLTRRLFSAPAIAWALALYGLVLLPTWRIREAVSPWTYVGASAHRRWPAPGRWASAVQRGDVFGCVRPCPEGWGARQVAARAAATLAAHAPPSCTGPPHVLAFHGAAHAG